MRIATEKHNKFSVTEAVAIGDTFGTLVGAVPPSVFSPRLFVLFPAHCPCRPNSAAAFIGRLHWSAAHQNTNTATE